MQTQKTRSYNFGFFGALLALLAFFVPFANSQSIWTFVNNVVEQDFGQYYDSVQSFGETSTMYFAIYLAFIAAAGIAFLFACHKIARFLTIVPGIFFLIIFLQEGPEMVSFRNIGFCLSALGLLLMLLGPSLINHNKMLTPALTLPTEQMAPSESIVGIFGAALTLVGFFLPNLIAKDTTTSLYAIFRSELYIIFVIVYIAVLVGIGVAYYTNHHLLGKLLAIPYAAYFVVFVIKFSFVSALTTDHIVNVGFATSGFYGLWATIIGSVLMVFARRITKALVPQNN